MTPSGLSMGMTLKMYLLRSATAEGVELTRNFRTPGEGRRRGGVVGGEGRGGKGRGRGRVHTYIHIPLMTQLEFASPGCTLADKTI